jgi:pyruvate kinase
MPSLLYTARTISLVLSASLVYAFNPVFKGAALTGRICTDTRCHTHARVPLARFATIEKNILSGSNSSSVKVTTVAGVPKLAQRWRKSTKQLATLGPASSNKEMIEKLFLAGADVFRLNFSHGSQDQKKELVIMIREIEDKYSHPIAILGDLQGPKLRVRFICSTLSIYEI